VAAAGVDVLNLMLKLLKEELGLVYHKNPKLEFYYMTHIENLNSILEHGILSRSLIESSGWKPKQIANLNVVKKRKEKGLDRFANLYIHPRNAMLYQVSKLGWENKVVVLGLGSELLNVDGVKLSLGNAAADKSLLVDVGSINDLTGFFRELLEDLREIRYWGDERFLDISKYFRFLSKSGSLPPHYYISEKQFLQSEILIPYKVKKKYIKAIYVPNEDLQNKVRAILEAENQNIPVVMSTDLFFLPLKEKEIAENIKVIQGDMFISDAELLTISVNTVGIMGKGLASRFKYMYPEAYVVYQDMCKRKQLQPGKPQVYWSESYKRYFLFFPTKKHWKENSKLEMIEAGLKWCLNNLPKYKIKSAAFPALGCGLGRLSWDVVGPLMVEYLSKVNQIEFEFYLPIDKNIPDDYFSKDFYKIKEKKAIKGKINLELF